MKEAKADAIAKVANKLNEDDTFIGSCAQVTSLVNSESDLKVKNYETLSVMKAMGMRFKKIQHVPLKANSDRNLIIRQHWAITTIEKDHKSRVFLNIDETWLGICDFRRRKWRAPDTTNSVAALSLAPRVTMLTAVDTLGNVYFSLSQSNSNHALFGIFMQQLVLKLDKERPHWRKNTIVTLDGAGYHRA